MSRFLSTAADHGGQLGLPAVVEELLVDVVADGFTVYCCGPKDAPNALVACYEWGHYLDLLTIQDFDRITTARVPTRATLDIFAPEVVVWAYEGPPQQALRALLELVHPAHPDAPINAYPAPASLHIPRSRQRPMTIRPPAPGRARVRAQRLATVMTPLGRPRSASPSRPTPGGQTAPSRASSCGSVLAPIPDVRYVCAQPPGHDRGRGATPCSDAERTVRW
ncbi:MAG: hypothetical protein ACRDSR_18150 [Pseudonocardiaceae bacterium]